MTTPALSLNPDRAAAATDSIGAPMLGRAWALMSQASARRTAAELRRQAAVAGDGRSEASRELLALADAVEACKS